MLFVFERTFRYETKARSMSAAVKAFNKQMPQPLSYTTNVSCEDTGDEQYLGQVSLPYLEEV